MADEDEVMDLTQNDYNDDSDDMPDVLLTKNRSSTSDNPPLGSGKAKGKGKRISVGSLEAQAKKKTRANTKQQQAAEKAARKAAEESNKIYKPGECMKHMVVEMHPALHGAWYAADVGRELAAAGARCGSSPQLCDPALLVWTRATPPGLVAAHGVLGLRPSKEPCGHALYVLPVEEIQEDVSAHTLSQRVERVRDMAGGELTLVVFGVKEMFKSSRRKTANSNRKVLNEIDLEMAITDVLVTTGCDTVLVNSPNELALLIVQLTKAIAEAPFKKAKRAVEEQAEFYMKGDNKNCIAIDKDGNGLARLWQQMLAVLPQSSLETSRAICAQYKSPRLLYEALKSQGATEALADVGVSRAALPGARARRLGPDAARRLHALFTQDRPDVLLD